jgi:glycosyltransferase involved in cell wall biosynthesis
LSVAPLVTIGIVNYNCLKFLDGCIESYLKQTYKNIELILIDDCSTDGSAETLKQAAKNIENARCILHEKNSGGPSQGIQEVIREAGGKYLQWIASDDFIEGGAIPKFVDYLEETNKDYVYSNFNIVDENNAVKSHWNYTLPTLNEMVYRIFTNCSGVIPMNGLYRAEFFRRNDITWSVYRDNDYSSDTINSLYFIKNGMKYGMINDSLINYRVHDNNYSHNIEKRIQTSITVYDYIIKNFNEAVYFPGIRWDLSSCREQLKCYEIASFLYKKIMGFVQGAGIPGYIRHTADREMIRQCLRVFIEEGTQYIRKGMAQGDNMINELVELEKKYKSIF